jgi:propane monooxygenase large subunit
VSRASITKSHEKIQELIYHGRDLAEIVEDLGYVRDDGRTLVAQPRVSLDSKDMWTIDDVRDHTAGGPAGRVPA